MSLIKPYPYEERERARKLIKRLKELRNRVELMAKDKIPFDSGLIAGVTALTETSDLANQHKALGVLSDLREKAHLDHLCQLAPDDLTAFAEFINPNEPPPRHLIFLDERLMEIEGGDRDRLLLSMPPGHAKDLDVETPVMMFDGTWKRLGDIEVGDEVITMKGRAREVLAVHEQGVRPVLKIITESGRVVRPHPEHLFLTAHDWVPAEQLEVGSYLALPREFEIPNYSLMQRDEFAFLGYMLARAIVTGPLYSRIHRITTKFRCDDAAILADIKSIADRLGFHYRQSMEQTRGKRAIYLEFDETCAEWLEEQGVYRQWKKDVRVPEWVFKGSDDSIGAFLGAVVSCDAKFYPAPNKQTRAAKKLALTIRENKGLAQDLHRLFMRIGVKSTLRLSEHHNYNYEFTTFFRIEVLEAAEQSRLAKRLRIIGVSRRFWSLPLASAQFSNPEYVNDKIVHIAEDGETQTRCLTVEEDHSFLAEGLIVHNSTHASRLYPAWYLGRGENRIYLQAGHSKDFARTEFGRKTKDLVSTEAYRKVFPGLAVRFDAKAADDWMLTNGNRYVTKGVGEGISGFRSTNNAVDDPYKDYASAQSPAGRKKVWEWFVNDFMTRLLPQGNAFVISTRWHIDDVIGHLIDMMETGEITERWDVINLPAICTDPTTDQLCRKFGEPLWPEFYSETILLKQKALQSNAQWGCLYDGNPLPAEGNIIKNAWLEPRYKIAPSVRITSGRTLSHQIEENNTGPENSQGASGNLSGPAQNESNTQTGQHFGNGTPFYRRTVVSVDSAEKETDRADFSAITVWREGLDKRHYLADAHLERMDFPKLLARVTQYANIWDADYVLMEEKGAGTQFIQHFSALPVDDQPRWIIVPINPGKDGKVFRMDAVTPIFQALRVVLPERAPWLNHFMRELLQFPGGKHDDYPDSVSQYLKWARDTGFTRLGSKKLKGTTFGRSRHLAQESA